MGRTKEKKRPTALGAAQKERDTILMILAVTFLLGGISGCLLEQKFASGIYFRRFLEQAVQDAPIPTWWRASWTVFRWPVCAVVLSLFPLAGWTLPGLFFLRGFFLSYGIVAGIEAAGAAGVWWAGIVFGATCLVTVPIFFILGTTGLLRQAHVPESKGTFLRRVMVCLPVLGLCVCAERAATPRLLHLVLAALSNGG